MDLKKFHQALLTWFNQNKRDLSFRRSKNSYAIWLSEVMLQQTTVEVVIPYFDRFLARYPNVVKLAAASISDILTLWQGLGYYSRARNLHKSAQIIANESAGRLPVKYDDWLRLPGIGPYTAAAITSIAHNERVAVLDGNVMRVLTRLMNYRKDLREKGTQKYLRDKALELLNTDDPGDHNQALMELGALVCTKKPLCVSCPVAHCCVGREKKPENLPVKSKIKYIPVQYHLYLFTSPTHIILEEPHDKSLVKGMWQLPGRYGAKISHTDNPFPQLMDKNPAAQIQHAITNKRINAYIYTHPLIPLKRSHYKMIRRDELDDLPLGSLARKAINAALAK